MELYITYLFVLERLVSMQRLALTTRGDFGLRRADPFRSLKQQRTLDNYPI